MSKIEWTDRSDWNPVRGCTRVSPGCGGPGKHGGCYAEALAARFSKPGQWGHGFAEMRGGKPHWTGKVQLQKDRLTLPLSWRKPAKIFVNSASDLFHESLSDEAIDRVFAVMALSPWHTYQVLTKRATRMLDYFSVEDREGPDVDGRSADYSISQFGVRTRIMLQAARIFGDLAPRQRPPIHPTEWPLSNVWLGVSVEDQQRADERRYALGTVAALGFITFVSYEPALGPVDWRGWWFLKQLISGGESGPRGRPSHPKWHRDARDFCGRNHIAYFFKQWGEFAPGALNERWEAVANNANLQIGDPSLDVAQVTRVGKKAAGRLLDGHVHNGFPVGGGEVVSLEGRRS